MLRMTLYDGNNSGKFMFRFFIYAGITSLLIRSQLTTVCSVEIDSCLEKRFNVQAASVVSESMTSSNQLICA